MVAVFFRGNVVPYPAIPGSRWAGCKKPCDPVRQDKACGKPNAGQEFFNDVRAIHSSYGLLAVGNYGANQMTCVSDGLRLKKGMNRRKFLQTSATAALALSALPDYAA